MWWDAIIIGAGPAGLTAAEYLGRFRRQTLIVHDGQSRARWIPTSHNTPGFPAGVGGVELLSRLEAQAQRYGATSVTAQVQHVRRVEEGFEVGWSGTSYHARFVVIATGVADRLPSFPGIEDAIRQGTVRICPICDAYEAIDRSIAVLGDGEHGIREAEFLSWYSDAVSLIHVGPSLEHSQCERIAANGIELIVGKLQDLRTEGGRVVLSTGSENRTFDVSYIALGCKPRSSVISSLGPKVNDAGALVVNAHQETSIPGVYAAGDVVRGLNQIIIAAAEGAIAATDIHNRLRGRSV